MKQRIILVILVVAIAACIVGCGSAPVQPDEPTVDRKDAVLEETRKKSDDATKELDKAVEDVEKRSNVPVE